MLHQAEKQLHKGRDPIPEAQAIGVREPMGEADEGNRRQDPDHPDAQKVLSPDPAFGCHPVVGRGSAGRRPPDGGKKCFTTVAQTARRRLRCQWIPCWSSLANRELREEGGVRWPGSVVGSDNHLLRNALP